MKHYNRVSEKYLVEKQPTDRTLKHKGGLSVNTKLYFFSNACFKKLVYFTIRDLHEYL